LQRLALTPSELLEDDALAGEQRLAHRRNEKRAPHGPTIVSDHMSEEQRVLERVAYGRLRDHDAAFSRSRCCRYSETPGGLMSRATRFMPILAATRVSVETQVE
jgi:hypothetical protein